MELLTEFVKVYLHYGEELWLTLAIGFLLSGLFFKFIPSNIVERHLGKDGIGPIFIASVIGIILPVCCIGSLPIALTLHRKGARLGAVLAFLVATPATSISALIVCWKLLGFVFTFIIFAAVIIMALIMGIVCDGIKLKTKRSGQSGNSCCHEEESGDKQEESSIKERLKGAVVYGFITLPREMGVEVLIGIALASFITVFEPLQQLIHEYLTGLLGYFFVLIVGLLTYVCSTASVPMADAFLQSGMSYGQALCYLLVGPITSYGTILVIKKDFGTHVLVMYLSIIIFTSLLTGIVVDLYLLN